MTLIAYIILLVAGIFDLLVMLRLDTLSLQELEFDHKAYSKRLKDNGEFTSSKRLLALAVLLGLFTDMAQMSWIVVLILAAALLAQGIVLLLNNRGKRPAFSKRASGIYATSIALAVLVLGVIAGCLAYYLGEADACRYTAMAGLLLIVGSPLMTMVTNRLFGRP